MTLAHRRSHDPGPSKESATARLLEALALLLVTLGAPGCGWHAGLVLPEGAHTVGVEIFDTARDLQERNLEPLLADAVTRSVIDLVRAPLVAPERADVVLRGRILDYRRRAGIRDAENRLIETGLLVSISAELVERRSGRVLASRGEEHVWTGYLLGEQAAEHESEARDRSVEYIARSLVLNLFRPTDANAP